MAEIDCCLGCPHDCRYCYARTAALKKGAIERPEQWPEMHILPEEVEKQRPQYSGQVMFPANHDITGENLDAAVTVIGKLLASGNRVLVVSKPAPACIARLCRTFAKQREQILFRFTITARDQDILDFWEPGAPTFEERFRALVLAYEHGFETSVSIEPMLDAPDVVTLVADLGPYVTHSIWVGKMNKIDERVANGSGQVIGEISRIRTEQEDHHIVKLYETLKDNPLIRWKESIKQVIGLPLNEQPGLDR